MGKPTLRRPAAFHRLLPSFCPICPSSVCAPLGLLPFTQVHPFLDFVSDVYTRFRETVDYYFGKEALAAPAPAPPAGGSLEPFSGAGRTELAPSHRSFRIVTECPLTVMFLFQLYHRFIQAYIPKLLPTMARPRFRLLCVNAG